MDSLITRRHRPKGQDSSARRASPPGMVRHLRRRISQVWRTAPARSSGEALGERAWDQDTEFD